LIYENVQPKWNLFKKEGISVHGNLNRLKSMAQQSDDAGQVDARHSTAYPAEMKPL